MPNTVNQHLVASPSAELRGFQYAKVATVAALPVTGQAGEIVTVTETGVDYQWNTVLAAWVPWHNPGTVLSRDVSGAAAVSVAGRSAVELRLTGDVTALAVTGWDTDTTRTQRVRFRVRQDATGGRSFAWDQVTTGTWTETPRSTEVTTAGTTMFQWYAVTTDGGATVWLEPLGVGLDCLWMQVAERAIPAVAAGGSVTVGHTYSMVASVDLIEVATGRRVLADWAHITAGDPSSPVSILFSSAWPAGTYTVRVAGMAANPCGLVVATDTTAPTVLAVSPGAGATNVAPTAPITVTFSEPILANGAISLSIDGGAVVPATVTVSVDTATITPTVALAEQTTYRLDVGTGVTDLSANALAAPSSTIFTTGDVTAPTITGLTPANGATGIATTATVQVTFSEPVVHNGAITLSVDGGGAVAATVSVAGNTVTLTPTAPLTATTVYRIDVGTGVTDAAGNPLAAASSTTFTAADTTAPTITAISPASGATGVSEATTIQVMFSEPVNHNNGITLSVDGGAAVATTVSVAGNVVTLTPTAALADTTTYRIDVSTAVTDTSGNALAAASSTTFATPTWNQVILPFTATTTATTTLVWTGAAGSVRWVYPDASTATPTTGVATTKNFGSSTSGNITLRWQTGTTITSFTDSTTKWTYNLNQLWTGLQILTTNATGSVVTGNLSSLPASMQQLTVGGSTNVTGNLSSLPAGMTRVNVAGVNTITGDVASIPAGVTVFSVSGSNTISGSVTAMPPGTVQFSVVGNNTISGSLTSGLPSTLTNMTLQGSNTVSGNISGLPSGMLILSLTGTTTVSGDVGALPSGMLNFSVAGSNTTSGSINTLPNSLTLYSNTGNNTTTGSLANLKPAMTSFTSQGANTINLGGTYSPPAGLIRMFLQPAAGSGLPQADVDAVLAAIDALNTSTPPARLINLAGSNAAPSAAGATSRTNLTGRGWSVTTN